MDWSLMKPELTSFINRLFDDEDFVRSLYDESGKKDRLELFWGFSGDYGRLGLYDSKNGSFERR